MPVRHARLTHLPAEIDRLVLAHGGKVDQAKVDVLDDAAERLDPIDQAPYLVFQLAKAWRRQGRAHARQTRAVTRRSVVQRGVGLEQLDGEVAPAREQLLDQRLELGDEGVSTFGRKEFHMSPLRIVFVTGLAGAGQSQAIKSFEDLDFYCIEHLPPVALDAVVTALELAATRDVAIALDVRGDERLGDPCAAIDRVIRTHNAQVLFLDADDDLLVRRFSQTRRRHPFSRAGSVREAIDADRRALAPLRERATVVMDTTNLTHAALKERISAALVADRPARLAVTFVSFGFKYGVPVDLDLLFDVRFLRNPNYEDALAPLTGDDPAVGAFIADDPSLAPFVEKVGDLLDYLLPRYLSEGKAQLTIGVGCTGGRHRSVYVARRLLARLDGDKRFDLAFEARDLGRAS
jgi:RNase adapter protein RapZ